MYLSVCRLGTTLHLHCTCVPTVAAFMLLLLSTLSPKKQKDAALQALIVLKRARTALAAAGALCMLALTAALGRGLLLRSFAVIGLVTGERVGCGRH